MASYALLLLAFSSTYLLQFSLSNAQTHLFEFCEGGNYTTNSTYEANLNLLLSSLRNSTIANTTRFFNNSLGRNPDRIYGLLQCRGDFNAEDCKKCANTATEEVTTRCPYKRESIVFYDQCWLHYSNVDFISDLQLAPTVYLSNTQNIGDPTQFRPKLDQLMERLVIQAVSTSPNLFALGQDNLTGSQSLYGLVQCSQDISRSDCERCLKKSVAELPTCCDQKLGGRVLKPSCSVGYETYEFFGTQAVAPATPPFPPTPNTITSTAQEKKPSRKIVPIVTPTLIATLLLSVVAIIFFLRRKKELKVAEDVDGISNAESLQLKLATVAAATENFSHANMLGEGGFGPVYKGKLSNGQEIAVKRLSRNSGQGVEEFKNEVLLLAKLQHRNLVRLLGFCFEAEEKLLIYEFVANSSLDKFIFDPIKRKQLDWERRYHIIEGVARGLLYLHEDSQVRIIHRDLKASNILLDREMNPKISDFGIARLFVMDQTHGSTRRVVGTYGYMSPEYAMQGRFSTKSDVFSFGVLILEIISGKKSNSFCELESAEGLLTYAWRQWEEGTYVEFLDPVLRDRCNKKEVMRCIHIGLLCVQEDVAKRPTMAAVALMLNNYTTAMALPSAPAFSGSLSFKKVDLLSEEPESVLPDISISISTQYSINEASITEMHPR